MSFVLKLLGARPVRLRVEPGRVFTIGRSADADLCLEDKLISRRHCELEVKEGALEVRDLGSRNGTCLNGEKIQGKVIARPGDQIKVGSNFLLLEGERGESGDQSPLSGGARSGADAPPRPLPAQGLPSLPGYEFLKEIARGQTGRIYRAVQLVDRRDVAVKILDVAKASGEHAVKRFQREARALQRLDHPNIVKIFDVDRAQGMHFYSMEFVDGETLAERLKNGPIGAREALSIAIQVARALELAHKENVIHRDVSPRSILLTRGGVAKLSDFGFVKSPEEEGRSLTNLGEIVGDLLYSSPEQIRDPRTVDPRTDLYALGSTLFHALAGRPPFEGTNYLETLRKVLSLVPPRARDLVQEVPPKVDDAVAKLLEKDAEMRFQSATEVVRALEDALLDACSPGPAEPADRGAFGGGFSGTEFVEIVQFLEFNRKDGTLVVSAPPLDGEMRIHAGEIVSARAAGAGGAASSGAALEGEPAIVALLSAPGGTFRFRAAAPGEKLPETGLKVKPSVIALDAMRSRDERAQTKTKKKVS